MADTENPSALRELREGLLNRVALVAMFGVGFILGISGPFGTINVMPIVPRLSYWTGVVFTTYGLGLFIDIVLNRYLGGQATWLRLGVVSFVIGIVVTAFITVANLGVFGIWPETWGELLQRFGTVTGSALVVETGTFFLTPSEEDAPEAPAEEVEPSVPQIPPLVSRLPLEKRGGLISLSAENHYVNVTTTNGSELLLMRLSDAVREVGEEPGLQIHRSHWVALAHIQNVTRRGDRGEMTLSDDTTRPISRSYMAAVRDAGLLPAKP